MMFSYNNSSNDCSKYADQAEWLRISDILNDWCKADRTCREVKQLAILGACENGEIEYTRSDGKTFDDPVVNLHGRGILLINKNSFNEWKTRIEPQNSPLTKIATKTNLLDFVNGVDAEYISIGDAIDAIHQHIGLDQDINKAIQILNLAIGRAYVKPNIYKKYDFSGWEKGVLYRPVLGAFKSKTHVPEEDKPLTIKNAIDLEIARRLDDELPF